MNTFKMAKVILRCAKVVKFQKIWRHSHFPFSPPPISLPPCLPNDIFHPEPPPPQILNLLTPITPS